MGLGACGRDSEQIQELFQSQSGVFDDVLESGALDGAMSGNGDFTSSIGCLFFHADMAAFLSDNLKSISDKSG